MTFSRVYRLILTPPNDNPGFLTWAFIEAADDNRQGISKEWSDGAYAIMNLGASCLLSEWGDVMWHKFKVSFSALFHAWLSIIYLTLFTGPRYATGGYHCELCGQEMFFSGRLDDPLSFTVPIQCHRCQRKICFACHKADEEVNKYGHTYFLAVCLACFSGDGKRYVNVFPT